MPARCAARGVGDNVSPALRWSGAPVETRAFALIVEDPDAPTPRPIVHALALDIPGDRDGLAEGALAPGADPGFALGRGAFSRVGWSGPRPIAGHGPHAYVFQLVALARPLGLGANADLADALAAMTGAALARGRLTGFYERS
jgi:Raf kinase inhibitor-like YbhB/YbcL family protein